jgi:hypothetical protein
MDKPASVEELNFLNDATGQSVSPQQLNFESDVWANEQPDKNVDRDELEKTGEETWNALERNIQPLHDRAAILVSGGQ